MRKTTNNTDNIQQLIIRMSCMSFITNYIYICTGRNYGEKKSTNCRKPPETFCVPVKLTDISVGSLQLPIETENLNSLK